MGAAKSDTQVGRYEIEVLYDGNLSPDISKYKYFLFDTKVGEIVRFEKLTHTSLQLGDKKVENVIVDEESIVRYVPKIETE